MESASRAIDEVNGFELFEKPMQLDYARTRSDTTVLREDGEQGLEVHKRRRLAEKGVSFSSGTDKASFEGLELTWPWQRENKPRRRSRPKRSSNDQLVQRQMLRWQTGQARQQEGLFSLTLVRGPPCGS